jgi:cell division protein FtsB
VAPQAGQRRRAAAIVLSPLTRQIAALGLALCAVALSLAYPLRNYLEQQAAEQAAVAEQHDLERQIADLKAQQAALQDPAYIKSEAKRRLQYVSPGDTVYVVEVPAAATSSPAIPGGAAGTGSDDAAGSGGANGNGTGTNGGDGTNGTGAAPTSPAPSQPWYAAMWDTLEHGGGSRAGGR